MRRFALALIIVVFAALGAAGIASAKAKPVLTLSEELPGGELRALQPGETYFATETEFQPNYIVLSTGEEKGFAVECPYSTLTGTIGSNGGVKDELAIQGIEGGFSGEDSCKILGDGTSTVGEDLRVTASGFPWKLTLGPWGKGVYEGKEVGINHHGPALSGKLTGHITFTVTGSIASCSYHAGSAEVVREKRIYEEPGVPQIWQTWGIKKLTPGSHNAKSCPKTASTILGPYESLTGTGTTPIRLTWE